MAWITGNNFYERYKQITMQEIVFKIAEATNQDQLISALKQAIINYEGYKSELNLNAVANYCMLLNLKIVVKDTFGNDYRKAYTELQKDTHAMNMFKNREN